LRDVTTPRPFFLMDKIKFIKVKIKKILDPYNRPNKMNIGLNNKKKIIKKKKKKGNKPMNWPVPIFSRPENQIVVRLTVFETTQKVSYLKNYLLR